MSNVCVIPARYNSSRFPGKLLARAHGKTVLERTLEKARLCPEIDAVFVATDDERIADHAQKLGGDVVWTSSHCQNGTERIFEALQKEPKLQRSSILINLQGDHPCTEPETLRAVIHTLQFDPTAAVATPVTPIVHPEDFASPHVVKCVFDSSHYALYFSRSPIPYHPPHTPLSAYAHIGIYAYRTSFLKKLLDLPPTTLQKLEDLEQLRVLENGYRIKIAVVKERAVGVDTPQDLVKLEKLLCQ